jgi:hypothetical protein
MGAIHHNGCEKHESNYRLQQNERSFKISSHGVAVIVKSKKQIFGGT